MSTSKDLVKNIRAKVNHLPYFLLSEETACSMIDDAISKEASKWISVEERLPEPEQITLCLALRGTTRLAPFVVRFVPDHSSPWNLRPEYGETATHWQLIPPPPEVKS